MPVGHPEHFAVVVRERRRQLNLTLEAVKTAGGPTVPTMVRVEAGGLEDPRPSTLAKLDQALQWISGSAARAYWDGEPPQSVTARVPPVLDPGVAEIALPLDLVLELMTTQRRLAELTSGPALDRDQARAISTAFDSQVSTIVGMFVTDLLERNHTEGEPAALHPLLAFTFGELLDVPVGGDGESDEKLYRRWLAGKQPDLTGDLEREFQHRLDRKLRTLRTHER
ncbi:hypothetical protein [Nocardia sp. NBC_00511]|uniref:hypothetical protein n=1 Tax=Nocardia sp. NBC_00511 TaxID=2903591 RepID=UPI0030E03E50